MTPKRERFVEEYLIDTNGAKAAIRAGYSPKTAKEQAMKLMKVPEVQQAIAKRLEALSSAKIADVQEIMEYLTTVMRGETAVPILMLCGRGVQKVVYRPPTCMERLRAAELLGKRYRLFTDKVDLEGVTSVIIVDDIPDDDG